jgi:hypothetical protein
MHHELASRTSSQPETPAESTKNQIAKTAKPRIPGLCAFWQFFLAHIANSGTRPAITLT